MLKRVPRGYDQEFPLADDLRMKSFTAGHRLTQRDVTSPEFDDQLATAYAAAGGFTAFLCRAVGLPY